MYQEEFNKIVSNPAQLIDMDMVDVRSMAERYPYCQVAHIFYAKKLHDINNHQFENQLKKASIAVYDRNVLYEFIEKTSLQKPVLAGFEEENEKLETIVSNLGQIELDDKGLELEKVEEVQVKPAEETIEAVENEIIETQLQEEILSLSSEAIENEPIADEVEFVTENLEPEIITPEVQFSEAEISEQESEEIMQEFIQSIPELINENDDIPETEIIEEVPVQPIEETIEVVENEIIETQLQEEILSLSSEAIENELIADEVEFVTENLEQEIITSEVQFSEEEISEQESEEIMQEFIQSIPEFINENQDIPELEIEEEAKSAEIGEIYEESAIEELDHANQLLETPDADPFQIDMNAMLTMEDDEGVEDELIFDLPPYDIEFELGPLPEEQKINITIQRPVFEENATEQEEEVFADSFVGWLNKLGGTTKVNAVLRKESNRPIKLYTRKDQNEPVTAFQKQPEKVVDELVAGELAKKSIQADEHLITETYARILVMQGKYQKAVEMYSKLSLLKPRKSDYFAALIDQLKKRIK